MKTLKHPPYKQHRTKVRMKGTPEQKLELAKHWFSKYGWQLRATSWQGSSTPMPFTCENGHDHQISWSDFKSGVGCAHCSGKVKHTLTELKEVCRKAGFRLSAGESYKNVDVPVAVVCTQCGAPSNKSYACLRRGDGCNSCYGNNPPTQDQMRFVAQAQGLTFLDLTDYINAQSKMSSECLTCGHQWQPRFYSVKQGHGCPVCNCRGFKYDRPGTLYYLRFIFDGTAVYKLGITNLTVEKRFERETVKPEILATQFFDSGWECYKEEQRLLKKHAEFAYSGQPLLEYGGNSELFTEDVVSYYFE